MSTQATIAYSDEEDWMINRCQHTGEIFLISNRFESSWAGVEVTITDKMLSAIKEIKANNV